MHFYINKDYFQFAAYLPSELLIHHEYVPAASQYRHGVKHIIR